MSNLTINTSHEFYLKAVSGGLKGTVFRLSSQEIFIGRDPSNHISIPDDGKMSRRHARLILNKGKYYIQNLSSKNFIKINNEKAPQAELKNNYVLSVGSQSFKFISVAKEGALATASNTADDNAFKAPDPKVYHAQQKNKKILYAVVGMLVVLGGFLSLSDPHKAEKDSLRDIATTEKILERVEASKKENEDLLDKIAASGTDSKEYRRAHSFYIKGFRDFQKGLYSTALSSFETCLSLYPGHQLAKRYSEVAKNRSEELIAFNINQGRANLENGKYDFCQSSFKNVMSSINDKTDPRFEEAKQNFNKCRLLQRSRY
jgi:pSer/pThr/pTyr-binding forkhead associated (FHA) protein